MASVNVTLCVERINFIPTTCSRTFQFSIANFRSLVHDDIRMILTLRSAWWVRNLIFAVVLVSGTFAVSAQNQKNLAGHVPAVARRLAPKGQLTATNELSLAIEVP